MPNEKGLQFGRSVHSSHDLVTYSVEHQDPYQGDPYLCLTVRFVSITLNLLTQNCNFNNIYIMEFIVNCKNSLCLPSWP
jgi:hypothetical protein